MATARLSRGNDRSQAWLCGRGDVVCCIVTAECWRHGIGSLHQCPGWGHQRRIVAISDESALPAIADVSLHRGERRKEPTSEVHSLARTEQRTISGALQLSHHAPIASVITVSGIPARQYAQNDISMPILRARSATIRFATEPTRVRLPAKVALIAITSQMRC